MAMWPAKHRVSVTCSLIISLFFVVLYVFAVVLFFGGGGAFSPLIFSYPPVISSYNCC